MRNAASSRVRARLGLNDECKIDVECLLELYSVSYQYIDVFLRSYIRIMSYCS